MAARLDAMGLQKYRGLTRRSGKRSVWTGQVRLDEAALTAPHRWARSRKVFVNSMSDLFHEDVPMSFIERVWSTMQATPRHTYQILTKRPARMRKASEILPTLPNVWMGTSVESSVVIDRLEDLRNTRAVVRFVSFEPLLGSVSKADLRDLHWAIVGGESGPNARPMESEWVEEIEKLCRKADVAFFFKQWGGTRKHATGRLLHGRTYDEMPHFSM